MNGEWQLSNTSATIPDPYNGEPFIKYPDTQGNETEHFVKSLRATPKSGLHNPLKNPERYELIRHTTMLSGNAGYPRMQQTMEQRES